MRIILEGCDGTGKSTVAKILAKKYNLDIVHMTGQDPKDYGFYRQSIRKTNVVFDRNLIGEMIYPIVFRRMNELTRAEFRTLIDMARNEGVKMFVFTCENSVLKERLTARGNECDEVMKHLEYINDSFKFLAHSHFIPIIDTTNKNAEEVAKEIIEIIEKGEIKND